LSTCGRVKKLTSKIKNSTFKTIFYPPKAALHELWTVCGLRQLFAGQASMIFSPLFGCSCCLFRCSPNHDWTCVLWIAWRVPNKKHAVTQAVPFLRETNLPAWPANLYRGQTTQAKNKREWRKIFHVIQDGGKYFTWFRIFYFHLFISLSVTVVIKNSVDDRFQCINFVPIGSKNWCYFITFESASVNKILKYFRFC